MDVNKSIIEGMVLENTFNLKDYLEDNVKLFSDFWQFLNEYYNDLLIFKNGEIGPTIEIIIAFAS